MLKLVFSPKNLKFHCHVLVALCTVSHILILFIFGRLYIQFWSSYFFWPCCFSSALQMSWFFSEQLNVGKDQPNFRKYDSSHKAKSMFRICYSRTYWHIKTFHFLVAGFFTSLPLKICSRFLWQENVVKFVLLLAESPLKFSKILQNLCKNVCILFKPLVKLALTILSCNKHSDCNYIYSIIFQLAKSTLALWNMW